MQLLDQKSLARTYDPPNRVDPWDGVELYRESQTYPDNWGSRKVARRMDVSRGEISRWVDGDSKPDAVHAIEFARDHGWLAEEWTPTTIALAELAVSIFAFGSIETDTLLPTWARTQPDNEAVVEAALEQVGTGYRSVPNGEETAQIRPTDGASYLGRALSVINAPVGHKNDETVRQLPNWVDDAPDEARETFALLLVRGRGYETDRRDTRFIKTRRSRQYFFDVADLIEEVTGESANVFEQGVTVSADAVRELGLA
ncbi:hypothetical protein SY89_01847 [Halolamina pelagica]|uniref:Uncharacterized protein n=2 Tax=Halolamina pelagica TaxID=699431 RepID=A0A0P7GPT1_9EURY|nr:hypothetical protein SY89_01847 [Halolamina pelagica]